MKYLLDVNALLAWVYIDQPEHHARVHSWGIKIGAPDMLTCAICELGFLRISMARYGYDLAAANNALALVKRDVTGYIDTLPPPNLARWVLSHKHTTDAYLCQLASAHGMKLATFDTGIKDSAVFHIP